MGGLLARLFGRERGFFLLLEEAANNLCEAAERLSQVFQTFDDLPNHAKKMKDLEHFGDEVTHKIVQRLNQTFVTPMDREDIHALAVRIDDVVDLMEAAVSRMALYEVKRPRQGAEQLAAVLVRAGEQIRRGIGSLENPDGVFACCAELNRLEDEADTIVRGGVARLFTEEANAVTVIKWKEILDLLETAVDRSEDVGDVLEAVVLKNS